MTDLEFEERAAEILEQWVTLNIIDPKKINILKSLLAKELDDTFQAGFDDGENDGYDAGYDDGFEDGQVEEE